MYRIMLVKSRRDNYASLYQWLTTTTEVDGVPTISPVEFETEEAAVAYLAEEGFDRRNGARPLRRTIRRKVEDPAAELLLEGQLKPGDRLCLAMTEKQLELRKIPV